MSNKQYLFLLGTHTELSVAELRTCGEVQEINEKESLAIVSDLQWKNPRELPKTKEQLFLDQLGGTVRFGHILGRYEDWDDLEKSVFDLIPEEKQTPKFRVGITTFGVSKNDIRDEFFNLLRKRRTEVRISNPPRSNMTSSRVFDERLIQKGIEILIWFRGDHYILAKTVATQNIRNYTIRDRQKGFRDAHMGMMPPKLAQMMINLASEELSAKSSNFPLVIDPFCGSGTVNIEAVLMGSHTLGSDLDQHRTEQSVNNFHEMASRFRYDQNEGIFFQADASKFPLEKVENLRQTFSSVDRQDNSSKIAVVTEGFLGENFRRKPTPAQVQHNAKIVANLWQQIFHHWKASLVDAFVFSLPCWKIDGKEISISKKVLTYAEALGWEVDPVISKAHPTYVYSRPEAFVGREICRVRKK